MVGKKSETKRIAGIPVWIWYVGGIAAIIFSGKIYSGMPTKKLYDSKDLLAISQLMAKVAKSAEKSDYDKPDQVKVILTTLNEVERMIGNDSDPNNMLDFKKQMLDAVSVIRGTVRHRLEKETVMSQAEVDKLLFLTSDKDVYTFDQAGYWEQHYEKSGLQSMEWYMQADAEVVPYSMDDAMTWPVRPANISEDGLVNSTTRNMTTLNDFFGPFGLDLPKDSRILMLGCGISPMSHNLTEKYGFSNIVNVDISKTLIKLMKEKYPNLRWEVQDAENMSYPDGSFDVVFEKGTIDALETNKTKQENVIKEARRVLGTSSSSSGSPKWLVQLTTRITGGVELEEHYGKDCMELVLLKEKDVQEDGSFNLLHFCKF